LVWNFAGEPWFAIIAKEPVVRQPIGFVFVYADQAIATSVTPTVALNTLENNLIFLVSFVTQGTRAQAVTWFTFRIVVFPLAILIARGLGTASYALNAPFALPVAFWYVF
jgi:hypothetical protein